MGLQRKLVTSDLETPRNEAVVMRSRWPMYLLLCGPLGGVAAMVIITVTSTAGWGDLNNIGTVGFLLALVLGFYIFLASFELVLTSRTLTYRRIFKARRTVALSDITNWEIKYSMGSESNLDGVERLLIWTVDQKEKPLIVNIGIFSRANYQKLVAVLTACKAKKIRVNP